MEKLNELKTKFDRIKTIVIAASVIDLIAAIFLIVTSISSLEDKMTLNELLYIVVIVLSSIICLISIVMLVKLHAQIKIEEKNIEEVKEEE